MAIDFVVGSDNTRTFNQTVMSGSISIGFVDFAAFLFGFDGFRLVLSRLFLVRNWCGNDILAKGATNSIRSLVTTICQRNRLRT